MAKVRRTKKLIDASRALADERFCDAADDAVLRAVMAGEVTVKQVYAALRHFGYRWDSERGRWRLMYPGWVLNFHIIERRMRERRGR